MKKLTTILLLTTITIAIISSCKKQEDVPVGNKIEFKSTSVNVISVTKTIATTQMLNTIGNAIFIQHGHCWGLEENPTIANDRTELGSTIDTIVFLSNIEGLILNMNYHIRAYFEISDTVLYSQDVEFVNSPCGELIVEYEGNSYHTVQIGNQCWFKENLNYETGNSWCYDNDGANCDIYGRLYDWATIMNGATSSNTVPSGVQGICPPGWHIPSDEEWKKFEGNADTQYGVGDAEWDKDGYRGYNVGLRSKSISYWWGVSGIDALGFSALPGGYHNASISQFGSLEGGANFWTSTEFNALLAKVHGLTYNDDKMGRFEYDKSNGSSVRCLKD